MWSLFFFWNDIVLWSCVTPLAQSIFTHQWTLSWWQYFQPFSESKDTNWPVNSLYPKPHECSPYLNPVLLLKIILSVRLFINIFFCHCDVMLLCTGFMSSDCTRETDKSRSVTYWRVPGDENQKSSDNWSW